MKVIAYHGSRVPNLQEFDLAKQGTGIVTSTKLGGFFFTSCPENAEFYADFDGKHPDEAFIVRVELTLENPFVAPDGAHPPTVVREVSKTITYDYERERFTGPDSIVCPDTLDGDKYSTIYFVFNPESIKILGYGK